MSIGRNTVYNLVGQGVPLVLGLVTVPIYLNLVGPDRYGVLTIAWLLLGYFGLFDLGLGRATSYQIAALNEASDEERASVFWSAILINLVMGVVGAAVLLLSAHYFFSHMFKVNDLLRKEIVAAVPLLALSVPIATLTGVLSGSLIGRGQFLWTNVISITSTSLFQVLPLAVAWWIGPNLSLLLLAAIAARVIAIVVLWVRCNHSVAHGLGPRFDRKKARALLGYGGWVTLTSLFAPALMLVDRFAIGAVLGAAAVTIYTIPFQLAQRITIVPLALTTALFPHLPSASIEERNVFFHRAIHALASVLGTPVLIAILLLHPFLDLWVGPELGNPAASVGRLLIFGFWINAFAIVPYTRMEATGRPDMVVKVHSVEIPVYLAMLYLFMRDFGLTGCAAVLILRNVADYCLLSYAATGAVRNIKLLLSHAAVLCAGLALASLVTYGSATWWMGSIAAVTAMAALSWVALPHELKQVAIDTVRSVLVRGSRQAK